MELKSIIGATGAFLLASLFLLPTASLLFGVGEFPFMGLIDLAAKVPVYLAAAVHEAGHLLFAWSFGIPALPILDLSQHGGVKYFEDRAWLLQWFVWFFMVGFILWLWFKKYKRLTVFFMFFLLIHIVVGSQGGYEFVVAAAGYGAEAFIGLVLLWRVFSGNAEEESKIAKFMSLFLGFFIYGHILCIFGSLATAENVRSAYGVLQNTHLLSDIEQMAFIMSTSLNHMAMVCTMLLTLVLASTMAWLVINPD